MGGIGLGGSYLSVVNGVLLAGPQEQGGLLDAGDNFSQPVRVGLEPSVQTLAVINQGVVFGEDGGGVHVEPGK